MRQIIDQLLREDCFLPGSAAALKAPHFIALV